MGDLGAPVTEILDGVPDGPFPAAMPPPPWAGVPRLYANASLNGRIPHALPAGAWGVRWRSPLQSAVGPEAVLCAAGRVAAVKEGVWELFDHDGHRYVHGATESHRAVLDPQTARLWTVLHSGILVAYDLDTGARRFVTYTQAPATFLRDYLEPTPSNVWLVSIEALDDIHQDALSRAVTLERVDLGGDLDADASGFLPSAREGPRLTWIDEQAGERPYVSEPTRLRTTPPSEPRMLAAAANGALTLATFDRVYVLDAELAFLRVFRGSFEPLALSVDERGRTHLIVRCEERCEYWTLDANGVRVHRLTLPPTVRALTAPPVVAYNHTVFLVTTHAVFAVHPDGRLLWTLSSEDEVVGAVLTADNRLLVTTLGAVVALTAQGVSEGLFGVVGDEPFCTAAVITAQDTIVVATRSSLLCYEREVVGERTLTTEGFNWSGA
ncbi:MAG: hypothetical protein U0325_04190 [Polyangiales bacterium]